MKVLLESLENDDTQEKMDVAEEAQADSVKPDHLAANDVEPASMPTIPDKSRSLRARSVQKRFQTELKMTGKRKKDPSGKAGRMTKYRRKAANAKERERMKKVNEAFDRLREVMPDLSLILQDEKDTKVTTLRAAITYIYGLQNLLEDIQSGNIDPVKYKQQEPQVCHKKPLKPTKSASKSRSQSSTKPSAKTNLKISSVTLAVKGSGKKCDRRTQSKYILPLRQREESSSASAVISGSAADIGDAAMKLVNPVIQLPDQPVLAGAGGQMIQTIRVDNTPNLLFLQPVPEKDLETSPATISTTTTTTPLPSMDTLKRSTGPCEFYVVLNGFTDPVVSDLSLADTSASSRHRRDSGSSSGISFRSLSSSPSSSLSSPDLDMETTMDCSPNLEKQDSVVDIPGSPTDLEPTIDQLFRRTEQQHIEAMDQFVILEDIHQIIGESNHCLNVS